MAFYREQLDADVIERGTESTEAYADPDQGDTASDDRHVSYAALAVADKRLYLFDQAQYFGSAPVAA